MAGTMVATAEKVDLWAAWRAAHDEVTATRRLWDEARAGDDWAGARAAFVDHLAALGARADAHAALRAADGYNDEQRQFVLAALKVEASGLGIAAGEEGGF